MTVVAATPSLLRETRSAYADRSVVKVNRLTLLGSIHMAAHVVATWTVRNLPTIPETWEQDSSIRLGAKFPTETCRFRDGIVQYIVDEFGANPALDELTFEFKPVYGYKNPPVHYDDNDPFWKLWKVAYNERLEREIDWPSDIVLKVTRRNGHVEAVLFPEGVNSTESKILYQANLLNG